jgi:D-amino peptidase
MSHHVQLGRRWSLQTIVACALSAATALGASALAGAQGQSGARKVFISVDMEGISGISGDDQLSPSGGEYARSRKLMAEDANAAIRGALAAGATDILVNDSHGGQRNLLPEDLHPAARLISHSFKRHGMMEGLDESFDAVLFIGYHAKAGDPRGLFAHTGSGVVTDLRLDGVSVGEGGMNARMAAFYGVPVALVTGDDVAVAEITAVAPGVKGVVVKRAINLHAVELQPLGAARAAIEAGAREALSTRPAPRPVEVELRFRSSAIPEIADGLPGLRRPAPDVLAFTAETMPAAYRLIRFLYRYVAA